MTRATLKSAAKKHIKGNIGILFVIDLLLGLIVGVFTLDFLDPGLHPGHLHHALFALGSQRKQNKFQHDGEYDQRQTIVIKKLV